MNPGVFLLRYAHRHFLTAFFVTAISGVTAFGQGITVHTTAPPINILSVTDVDLVHATTSQWLFTVDINAGGRTVVANAEIKLNIALANGDHWDPAISLTTKRFIVNGSKTFSNLDIGTGKAIEDSSSLTSWNHEAESMIKDISLPSGQLPAGTYTFNVTVNELTPGSGSSSDHFAFVLTNPSSVELLFPIDGDRSVSALPLFQWVFDGSISKLQVFELLPNQSSLEEATQGVPIYSVETRMTSQQYPLAGARQLQAGRTYVWYIEGRVTAPGGRAYTLRSPVRSFTVDAGASSYSSLLDELERVLDPKYKPLFDQIRSESLLISGPARTNGAVLPASELLRILDYLRKHPDAVQSAGLE